MGVNETLTKNLAHYRKWVTDNAITRAVYGVLPTFYDKDSRDLTLVVDDSMQPRTDGKTVWISLIPDALQSQYTEKDWQILIFVALCHELLHGNCSNFDDIELIGKWFAQYVKDNNLPISELCAESIARELLNIVEDGRIESIGTVRWPGMIPGFKLLNRIIRQGTTITSVAVLPQQEYLDFTGNCLSYAKTGLFSPGIHVYADSELETVFLKCQPIIDEGINARTSQDCRKAVEKLLAVAAEYLARLIDQSEQLQKTLQEHAEKTPEYTQNNESEYNESPSSGMGNPLRSNSPTQSQSPEQGGDGDSGGERGNFSASNESGSDGLSGSHSTDHKKGGKEAPKTSKQSNGQAGEDKANSSRTKSSGTKSSDGQRCGSTGGKDGAGQKAKEGNGSKEGDDPGNSHAGESAGDSNAEKTDGSPDSGIESNGRNPIKETDNCQSPMGFCDAVVDSEPLTPQQLEQLGRMAAQAIALAKAQLAEECRTANDGLEAKALQEIRSSYPGQTKEIVQQAMIIPASAPIPPDLKREAAVLRREIERILVEKRRSQRGLRRGALDPNALWKSGVGDGTIFARRGSPQAGSCAFYILADNSGSTKQEAYSVEGKVVPKYQAERMAAAVIEDAAVGLIPCKIVLFDQSNNVVNHQIIRTFDERSTKNRAWNSLTSVPTGGYNADSVHIRIATEELKKRPEQKKVLFVLSDGMPSAYCSKYQAEGEVNAAVSEARRKGIIVIPIMFGQQDYLKTNYSTYMKMYSKDVIACVPQEITTNLVRLFRLLIAR